MAKKKTLRQAILDAEKKAKIVNDRIEKRKKAAIRDEPVYMVMLEAPLPLSPGEEERLDIEPKYRWIPHHYTGTEDMCRSIAEGIVRVGGGAQLVLLDGTPDGKVVQTWVSRRRLDWMHEQVKKSP